MNSISISMKTANRKEATRLSSQRYDELGKLLFSGPVCLKGLTTYEELPNEPRMWLSVQGEVKFIFSEDGGIEAVFYPGKS